jgi:hypothetical protein
MSKSTTGTSNVIPFYESKEAEYVGHYLDVLYSRDPVVQQQIRDLRATGLALDKAIDKIIFDRWGISRD